MEARPVGWIQLGYGGTVLAFAEETEATTPSWEAWKDAKRAEDGWTPVYSGTWTGTDFTVPRPA